MKTASWKTPGMKVHHARVVCVSLLIDGQEQMVSILKRPPHLKSRRQREFALWGGDKEAVTTSEKKLISLGYERVSP